MRSGAVRHTGAPVAARRGLQKPHCDTSSVNQGAYHLPPLNAPVATAPSAASPRRASNGGTTDLPLTVLSSVASAFSGAVVPSNRPPLVSSGALTGPVQMWPAVSSTRQRRRQKTLESKSPLSLQLEGFIRREHQQYVREHPSCSRTDTLFIFREALATFVNHFSEYRGVLYLIRDEYDAALAEMTEKANRIQAEYLESQSDRDLHGMELIQLKESMNATISNQQAQLGVLQGLVHTLRDQLTAAEHANSMLTVEMEQKKKTFVEAQQQVKLLSHAMIEETARTAVERERAHKFERDAQLQESRAQMLQGHVTELEECLRQQAYIQSDKLGARGQPSKYPTPPPLLHRRHTALCASVVAAATTAEDGASACGASSEFVAQLLSRIDALEMKTQLLEQDSAAEEQDSAAEEQETTVGASSLSRTQATINISTAAGSKSVGDAPRTGAETAANSSVDALFPVVRQWLRMEGIDEAEVEATDVIVPPGRCMTEDMGFLSVVRPVKHRHLSLSVTLRLIETMWQARERPTVDKTRLREFFSEWLHTQAADIEEAKALGINILDTCQHNLHHAECRALLLILRGFLPEEVVHVWRRRLARLQLLAQVSPTTLLDKMPFEDFFGHVRAVCPEKSIANMLQLRFAVFHHCDDAEFQVTFAEVFSENSYFVRLFKLQWLQEVEKFTLQVTEGVREVADQKHNSVVLAKVMQVLRSLDPALSDEVVHTYISQSCQKPVIDVATADDKVTAHLDVMLTRLRSTVLLHRCSPEDALMKE